MSKKVKMRINRTAVSVLLMFAMVLGVICSAADVNLSAGSTSVYSNLLVEDVSGTAENLSSQYLKGAESTHDFLKADDVVTVIVELNEPSLIETYNTAALTQSFSEYIAGNAGKNRQGAVAAQQSSVINSLLKDYSFTPNINYTTLLNGFSATMRYGDILNLESSAYVKNVAVSEIYKPEEAKPVENEMNTASTGIYDYSSLADVNGEALDGNGLLIAVIDEGFDLTHEAFDFSVANPVLDAFAVDSLMDSTVAAVMSSFESKDVYRTTKIPFAYNYADRTYVVNPGEGHGTHVAGIATGLSGTIRGVAPAAQLACMQVFSTRDGSSSDEIILCALTDAVVLGADVVNMSLGMSLGFSEEGDGTVSAVYENVRVSGVSLSVSAGNDYTTAYGSSIGDTALASNPDTGTISYPASYESVTAVASINSEKTNFLTADDTHVMYELSAMVGSVSTNFISEILEGRGASHTFDYVKVGKGTSAEFNAASVSGKIAVVERGAETYENMAQFAAAKGAAGLIIYNNTYGHRGALLSTMDLLPVCTITQADGAKLKASGTMKIVREAKAGPFMSDFSSRGVLSDLILKPDITGPGENILSSMPANTYELMSGTSMAAPNIAGLMILLRQYLQSKYPSYNKAQIYELSNRMIMSTASVAKDQYGNPYTPRRQGAGIADLNNATAAQAYLYVEGSDKAKLSLGDDKTKTGVYTLTFNIENMSSAAKSFKLQTDVFTETLSQDGKTIEEKAYMLSYASATTATGNAKINGTTVSVLGYGTGTITVAVTLDAASKTYLNNSFANGMYVEGFVRLLPYDTLTDGTIDGCELSIPFVGFYGDWTAAPIFDADIYEVENGAQSSGTPLSPSACYYIDEETLVQGGLGEFSYNLMDSSKTPATSIDKAALSGAIYYAADYLDSELRGNFMLSEIEGGILRNLRTVDYNISETNTGNVIYKSSVVPYVGKSFYPGYRQESRVYIGATAGIIDGATSLDLPSNSQYTFTMSGALDYSGTQNNVKDSYSFSFFVDSQLPRLNSEAMSLRRVVEGGKTRYYLDMEVYENHYLEMMSIATFDTYNMYGNYNRYELLQDDYVIPLQTGRNTTTNISYELTDYMDTIEFNGGNIVLQLSDYAKNTATYNIKLTDFAPATVAFSRSEMKIDKGETVDLKEYLTSANSAWNSGLTWTSSDTSIVDVKDGEAFGANSSTTGATITVANSRGETASISIKVTSVEVSQSVTSLKFDYTVEKENTISAEIMHSELKRGDNGMFNLKAYPFKAAAGEIIWDYDADFVTLSPVAGTLSARYFIKAALPTETKKITITARIKDTDISVSKTFSIMEEFTMNGMLITSYNGYGDENGRVDIPSSLRAAVIGTGAFAYNAYITDVIIPEGVTSVGYSAFLACGNLVNVTLPASLATIGSYAFTECSKLTTINLENVLYVDAYGFSTCKSLTKVELSSAWYVGDEAFSSCDNLREVDISNVTYMGGSVFAYCTSLISIKTSSKTVIGFGAFNSTAVEHLVLYANTIGNAAFASCANLKSVVIINDLKAIGGGAFQYCPLLTMVVFNGRIDSIGEYAFRGTGITSVTLPEGIQSIGEGAFSQNAGLKTVVIPASAHIVSVGATPFAGTGVTAFTLQSGSPYHSIGTGTQSGANLYDAGWLYDQDKSTLIMTTQEYRGTAENGIYVAPSTLSAFGTGCFMGNTNLTIVKLPENKEIKIGDYAFTNSKIKAIQVYTEPSSDNGRTNIYHIGLAAFAATPLTTLPTYNSSLRKLEYVGDEAFKQSAISSFNMDTSNLNYLGVQAFYGCTNLTSINLKNSNLTVIYTQAFEGTGLTSVVLPDILEGIALQAFAYTANLKSVMLPAGLKIIGQAAFASSGLTGLYLPEAVKDIYYSAFYGCTALSSVYTVYKDGTTVEGMTEVLNIYNNAFYRTNITKLKADKLIYLGTGIVSMTTAANNILTEVYLPNVETIVDYAFVNATALQTVNIAKATAIGISAFEGCTSLSNLTANSAATIADYAFFGCTSLATANITSAKEIGTEAFAASGLTSIDLSSVETINEHAFYGTGLTTLTLPATLKGLIKGALSNLPNLTSLTFSGANPYYTLMDGVLYRIIDGGYQLEYYPVYKTNEVYSVESGTLHIAEEAFLNNKHLKGVTLPTTLKSIGSAAFYGCDNLTIFVFMSKTAPILESRFDKEYHDTFNNFGIPGAKTLNCTVPTDSVGYDMYVWGSFFTILNEAAPQTSPQTIVISHDGVTLNAANVTGIENGRADMLSIIVFAVTMLAAAALIVVFAAIKRRNYEK